MRRLVVKVLKNETILVVASILALISCFIVPPDKEYAGYIHASTISQLICLMLVAWPGAYVDRIAVLLRHAHHQ